MKTYYFASDIKALYAASINKEKKVCGYTNRVKVEPQHLLAVNGISAIRIAPLHVIGELPPHSGTEYAYILESEDVSRILAGVKFGERKDAVVCFHFTDDTLQVTADEVTERPKADEYAVLGQGNAYTVAKQDAAVKHYPSVMRVFEGLKGYASVHGNFDRFGIGVNTTAGMHAAISVLTKLRRGSSLYTRMLPVDTGGSHALKLEFRDKLTDDEPRIEALFMGYRHVA